MSISSKRARHQQRDLSRANRLHQRGKLQQSAAAYARYVQHSPEDKTGHYNLAVALEATRQPDAAMHAYCRALEIDPWYPEALNNLGIILHTKGHLEAAKLCYARALTTRPDYEDAEYNYATAESKSGNLQEAIFHFSRLLERNPRRADTWNNLGNALLALRSPAEALKAFRLARSLQPDLPDVAWNTAAAELMLGFLPEGWQEFEQRGKMRHTLLPRWDGSESKNKTVLVHAEQGLGDTIQFIRYCGQVKNTGAQVIVECHPELIPLLRSAGGVDQLKSFNSALPAIDYQIPLMSLPLVFRTGLDTIPCTIPYLNAEESLIEKWASKLDAPDGQLKVGLVWAGNPKHQNDRNRSIDPSHLEILGRAKSVALYSLQQKPQSAAISQLRSLPIQGSFDELTFADTAAILFNLDLVISVDTVVTHLAGALGRPVWTLLPFAPDWRWMLDRPDTPWYPTMRLFRQPRLGDWPSVLENVVAELNQLTNDLY
jgi:tetratricopeptide (TPR) repeat protein